MKNKDENQQDHAVSHLALFPYEKKIYKFNYIIYIYTYVFVCIYIYILMKTELSILTITLRENITYFALHLKVFWFVFNYDRVWILLHCWKYIENLSLC